RKIRRDVGLQVDGNAGAQRERFKRLHQAALGEHGRMQTARELPDLFETGGELVDGYVDQCRALLGCLAQASQIEQYAADPLLGAVMQVPLDASALAVGDLD